jgi:serine/threonine protein kinase
MEARGLALDLTGTTFDQRYQILGQLGWGGMGHVYAAVHLALEQRVAIKVLHPRFAREERFRARFLQEARAVSRIRHPNVVEIKDFGRTPDGSVYFVMEYLRGHDLSVELCKQGALPWARARNILLQAAGGLQAAHAKQIIHRDIKPGNCFLLDDEDAGLVDAVKLVDFGIAKVGDSSHKGLTENGEILGTASYMSPEQARSEPLDARSDVYSLGCMAYEMLTGLVPFRGSNALHVISAHLEEPPEPLRRLAPEIPAAADAMVLRMLAKAPEDRYESMKAIVQALRAIPETAGKRSTKLWTPVGDLPSPAEQDGAVEPALPSRAVGAGTEVNERTAVLQAEASPRRRVGEWPAIAMAGAHAVARASSSAGTTSSTEPQRAMNDTVGSTPCSLEPPRPSRRFAGLALLGLFGLLAGGGSVLVTKVWLSDDGARKSLERTVERGEERATEPRQPAAGDRGRSR